MATTMSADRALPQAMLVAFTVALSLLSVSCGHKSQTSSPSPVVTSNINDFLRQPGKITYLRYTSYTPPWPTRVEAWIDWDNNRTRSWNVQWTDSPTNPSVCTTIRNGDVSYFCLPSLEKLDPKELSAASIFAPSVPLRASDTELNLRLPNRSVAATASADAESTPVQLDAEATTTTETQGDVQVVVNSWKITSGFDMPCRGGQAASPSFEYRSTEKGEPISEFVTVACGEATQRYLGILYHEVRFVDTSDLPADFFDVDSARASVISDQLSSAAAQLGSVFWHGDKVSDWSLAGIEHDANTATITYSRGSPPDEETVQLTTRGPKIGRVCDNPVPIPGDANGGSLCARGTTGQEYTVVWNPRGSEVWLEKQSYPPNLSRDDLLALAAKLEPWGKTAPGPLLTSEEVSSLISDSLELVCPKSALRIRRARSTSAFTFDRKTGEWTGVFGPFGEYAVPDSKPVAIPTNNRKEVESTLSHNAAQFADCVLDEQPPPQPGDDEFAVKFTGKDDTGLSFEITGVDSQAEAAVTLCLAADNSHCGLTDPGGVRVGGHGVEIDDVRSKVERVHVGLKADELTRSGQWTFALALSDGRTAQVTFEVP